MEIPPYASPVKGRLSPAGRDVGLPTERGAGKAVIGAKRLKGDVKLFFTLSSRQAVTRLRLSFA